MKKRMISLAILLVVASLAGVESFAQVSQSGIGITPPNTSPASYYYVSKPGELTMQVNVWGFVHRPGRYEVSNTTDVVQLISFAGGPLPDADMDDVRISRIIRRDGTITTKEFSLNLSRMDRMEESKLMLYPGDTIFIDHTSWVTFRDIFAVFTTAAVITAAVAQVMNVTTR